MKSSPYLPVVRGLTGSAARRRSTIGGLTAAAVAVAVVVAGPEATSQAATTPNVDPTYGSAGRTTLPGNPSGSTVDAAGRTLTATSDGTGARLTRLTAAGARDTTFGAGGTVGLPYAGRVVAGPDGSATVVATDESEQGLRFHRVSATGATAASTTVLADRRVELVVGAARRADGVTIVHGIDQNSQPTAHLLVAITPAGTLATGWGTGGVLTVQDDYVFGIAAAGDTVLTVGEAGVRRYTAAGAREAGFGPVALPATFEPSAIDVSGGAYFVNGMLKGTAKRMATVKVLPTGVRDTSFGDAGMAVGAVHDCTPSGTRSFVTAAGVYLIGDNDDCGASRVYVHRFTAAGASDPRFGTAGEVVVDQVGARRSMGGGDGGAQPDGKVLVTFESDGPTASVVRLLPAAAAPPAPAPYVTLTPTRLLGPAEVGARRSVTLTVRGRGGVPATGVAAVTLDVTVARTRASGGIVAYPTGGRVPATATHAHAAGQAAAQRLTVPLGTAGRVTVQNASGGSALLAMNVVGYHRTGSYVPVAPARVLAVRGLGAGKATAFPVTGRAGVPATGVGAVLVNVTVSGVSRAGSLKLYPTGAAVPAQVLATHAAGLPGNAGIRVTPGTGGRLTVLNNATAPGTVTVDVVGYVRG